MKIRNVWFWIVWFRKSLNCELDVFYVLVLTVRSGVISDFILLILCCVWSYGESPACWKWIFSVWWCFIIIFSSLSIRYVLWIIYHHYGLLGYPMYIDHNKTRGIQGLIHLTNKKGKLAKVFRVTILQVWVRLDDKKKIEILTGWWCWCGASAHKWYYQIDPPGKRWTGAGQPAANSCIKCKGLFQRFGMGV